LEEFCECIFPRNSLEVEKVLEAVKQNKIGYGRMQSTAEELGVEYNKFNAIMRRLKDLGILTRNSTFSEVFEDKIIAIAAFFGEYTDKANPVQKALDDANEYLKAKGYSGRFEPQFKMAEEKEQEQEETGQ
jgi:hypothetical protein